MNTRQIEIVLKLIHNGVMSLCSLSETYSVTTRTLRQDFQELNNYFTGELNIYTVDDKVKIFTEKDILELTNLIIEDSKKFFIPNIEERKTIEAYLLLLDPEIVFAGQLSEIVGVSKGTISRDIPEVQEILNSENIELEVKRNSGFTIKDPCDLTISVCFKIMRHFWDHSIMSYAFLINYTNRIIDKSKIHVILRKFEYKYRLNLTDSSYSSILDYLTVLCCHRKNSCCKRSSQSISKHDADNTFLKLSYDVLQELETFYQMKFSQKDQMELSLRIQNSGFLEPSPIDTDFEVQMLVSGFIYDVFNDLEVREFLSYDSYILILQHITTMISRIREDILLKNPYLDEIKSIYSEQFYIVKNRIKNLEKQLDLILDENEISFIVIHILATMEKDNLVKSLVRVKIIGVDSRSMYELMKNKIEQLLGIKVLTPISHHQYEKRKYNSDFLDSFDLIVSPLSIRNSFKPSVQVKTFIDSEDLSLINKELLSIRQIRYNLSKNDMLNKIIHYSEKVKEILEKPFDKESLNNMLSVNYKENVINKSLNTDSLLRLIEDDSIIINESANDWETAIKEVALPLLDRGYIDSTYVKAMIENVHLNGPYMMFVPHVAVTHASPQDGVYKSCMSVLKLKNEVSFGHDKHDPCRLIFCLAVLDGEKDIKYFYKLMKIISNQEIVKLLLGARTKIEFKEILRISEIEVGESY